MSIQLPPATHRKRALPQGELEAASTLKLGADQNTHTLSLSEARLVIHKVLENKRRGGSKYEEPEYVTALQARPGLTMRSEREELY
jgi:DNA-directed RNA polymerase II subunit RPB4